MKMTNYRPSDVLEGFDRNFSRIAIKTLNEKIGSKTIFINSDDFCLEDLRTDEDIEKFIDVLMDSLVEKVKSAEARKVDSIQIMQINDPHRSPSGTVCFCRVTCTK